MGIYTRRYGGIPVTIVQILFVSHFYFSFTNYTPVNVSKVYFSTTVIRVFRSFRPYLFHFSMLRSSVVLYTIIVLRHSTLLRTVDEISLYSMSFLNSLFYLESSLILFKPLKPSIILSPILTRSSKSVGLSSVTPSTDLIIQIVSPSSAKSWTFYCST